VSAILSVFCLCSEIEKLEWWSYQRVKELVMRSLVSTKRSERDRRTDRRTDVWTDGRTSGRTHDVAGDIHFHFTGPSGSQKSSSEPDWLQNLGRNAASAVPDESKGGFREGQGGLPPRCQVNIIVTRSPATAGKANRPLLFLEHRIPMPELFTELWFSVLREFWTQAGASTNGGRRISHDFKNGGVPRKDYTESPFRA